MINHMNNGYSYDLTVSQSGRFAPFRRSNSKKSILFFSFGGKFLPEQITLVHFTCSGAVIASNY